MYLRKFIAGLLAAFMLLSLVPPAVFGDAEPFSLEGGTLTITGNWYPEDCAQRAGVTRIVIGPRVTSFLDANGAGSSNPFREYGALTEITVAANNPVYRSNDGVLLEKDAAGGALGGTEDAPKYWVRCCPILREGVFVLPEDVGGIGYLAFQEGCHTQVYARQATAAAVASLANIGGIPLEELPDEVYAPETPLYVNLTALTLDRSDAELVPGAALALSAAVEPEDATVRDVLWTSSDESVATVSNSGVVTAVASGTAVITAATAGVDAEDRHLEQTCEVFVSVPVAGLSSLAGNRSEAVDVDTGAEARTALSVKVSPANATYRTVTWTSTDPETALLSLSTDGAGAESLEQEADEDADGLSAVYVVPVASGETTVTASCGGYSVEFTLTLQKWVKDVALSPDSLLLTALGGTAALTPVYDPADADNITAQSWESDDTDIATVDRNGAVTAVANGETEVTLTVTASRGGPYTVTCPVKVEVPVERVELDETALTIEAGEDKAVTLKATVYPETAANKTVTWSSSDESVATVDVDGKVTGVKAGGPVWITVETEDGGKTASCAVTVKKTDATKLELEVTEPGEPVYTQAGALKLEKGGTAVLTATLTPDDATNKALNWATSDAAAVRIVRSDAKADENGVANATIEMLKTDANATVTVTSADNGALTQSLAVVCDRIPVERVSLDKSEVTLMLRDPLKPDGETTLTATVDPETATDPSVTWENSASGVVTVTRDSANPYMIHLTASGCGEATILAKGADGKQAACKVTVYAPVTGVTLNKSAVTLSLPDNDAEQLTATVLPAGQADQTVVWTSSKESVATVSDSGVVTAVGPGEAKITATAGETGYKAECAVTVEKPATELSFSGSGALSVELTEGTEAEDGSVTLYVTAEDATDQPVLTSSNDTVAAAGAVFSRKADGKAEYTVTVTAKKTGTATVTARCGAQTATLAVTVTTPVQSVTLNKTSLDLEQTKTFRLEAAIDPSNADSQTVSWESSAPAVATVDQSGLVTAVAATGSATVTASCGGKSAVCTVTAIANPVTDLTLSESALTLREGETGQFRATVAPTEATETGVTWTSGDTTVATVDENGLVKAVKAGETTVTVTTKGKDAAGQTISKTCAVTVTAAAAGLDHAEGQEAARTVDWSLPGREMLAVEVTPHSAVNNTVTWTVDHTNLALLTLTEDGIGAAEVTQTADEDGLSWVYLVPVASGTVTVTASCSSYSKSFTVTLNKLVSAVSLSPDSLLLTALGGTATLTPVYTPADADNIITRSWTSNDTSVATVAPDGTVTAVANGEATITLTVTASQGEPITATRLVKVEVPVTGVTLNKPTLSIKVGESNASTLTATVDPGDAATRTVTWASSDPNVATVAGSVDENGVPVGTVTGVGLGTAQITVTTDSGGKTASCAVTVGKTDVTSLELDKKTLTLTKDEEYTLTVTLKNVDATNKGLTWKTSDATAVQILESDDTADESGIATAKIKMLKTDASATVTVTSADNGELSDSCAVRCERILVESVSLDKAQASLIFQTPLGNDGRTTLTATVTPDDATDTSVAWRSTDPSVVEIASTGTDSDGHPTASLTAKKAGAADIYAQGADGQAAVCHVTVTARVTGVSLNVTEDTLVIPTRRTVQLSATVAPEGADQTVEWTSSNESVATVSDSGVVTAVAPGEAKITAAVPDTGYKAECTVTVEKPATGVAFSGSGALSVALTDGAETQDKSLTLTVTDYNATGELTFTSSNDTVAAAGAVLLRANDGGKAVYTVTVTAKKTGTATITAAFGSISDTLAVTVTTPVKSVTLNETSLSIAKTKTARLTATVLPASADNKTVTWTSNAPAVATVDETGLVTGVAVGTATITATSAADTTKTAACTVTVGPPPVEGVALSETSLTLRKDDTATLTATVSPDDATDKTVTWSTSNADVATVSESGVVTAKGVGAATITAASAAAPTVTATCAVTVGIAATGISIPEKLTLTINDPADEERLGVLTVTYQPSDTTDKAVTWQSQNTGVVTVTPRAGVDGVADLEAVAPGSAQVTVTGSGGTKVCTVTVLKPAGALTLSSDTLAIRMTDENPLSDSSVKATVTAPDHTDTFSVSSSDSSVAEVTADSGVNAVYTLTVTAKKSGTAIITARCGAQSATLTVTVTTPVASVTLPETLSVQRMASALLTATVLPANADNKAVTWSSSDETVATVDENTGLVTGVAMGQATITATSRDGGKTGTCTVTVGAPSVERISLSQDTLALKKGGATATLQVTFTPADAADQTVSWSTSDSEIATVAGGVVTPVGVGRATVTATSNDGGKTAACAVTVTADVTGLTLNYTGLELAPGGQAQQLVAILTPANGTYTAITWSSSDPGIATVSDTGLVSPVRVGSATVTCTLTRDGLDDLTAACEVTVGVALNSVTIQDAVMQPVTDVTLNMVEAADNHTKQLLAALDPPNATDSTVSWSSTDESVVAVDNTGRLTAVGPGSATVTVTAGGDKTASCTVTVERGTVSFDGVTQSPAAIGLTEAVTFTYGPCDSDFTLTQTLAGTAGIITPDTTSAGSVTVTPVGDGKCTLRLSGPRNSGKYTEVSGEWTFLCMNTPVSGVTVTNQPGELLAVRLNNNGGSTSREIIVEGISRTDPAGIDWESRLNISLNANLGELLADGTLVKSWSGNVMTLTMGGKAITYTVVYSAVRWLENGLDNGSANDTVVFVNATGVETGAEGVTIAPVEKIKESALGDRGLDNTGNQYRVDVSLQVDYVSSDDQTLTLNVKPAYRIYPTTGENTGTPLYTGTVTETGNDYVHITVLLDFKPELIQHIHRDGSSVKAEYPEFSAIQEGGKWKVDWWQNTFSEVNILGSVRSGAIRFAAYGGGEILLPVNETDLETALPADRRDGCVFRGWEIEGLEGVYDSLTDEVLSAADGAVLQAEPVFDSDGTLTASIRSASAENGVLTVSTDSNAPCAATLIAGFYRNGQMVAVAARAVTLSGGRDAWTLDIPADASRSLCRVFLLDGSGAPLSESKICGA